MASAWAWLSLRGRLAVVALAALLLVGLPGMCFAARSYVASHLFEARNGEPIRLSATVGERVTLAVRVTQSLDGYWAAPEGILLSLEGEDDQVVVSARENWWGDSVLTDQSAEEEAIVRGAISVPDAAGTGRRTVAGTLHGPVVYPTPAFRSRQFRDDYATLSVPVEITLVPAGDGGGSSGLTLVRIFVLLSLALGAMLVVLAVTGIARGSARRRAAAQRAAIESTSSPNDSAKTIVWLTLIGAGLSGLLILFGLSSVLQLASGLYRTIYERAVLDAPGLVIWAPITVPALLWLATTLALIAWSVGPRAGGASGKPSPAVH